MDIPITLTFKRDATYQLDLDVWLPDGGEGPTPTMVWFHGGGGFCGDKSPNKSQWFTTWMKGGC